jgi:hypoxanthine phosphoribosyltransferase
VTELTPAPELATILGRDEIARCVQRLAREIEDDHPDGVVLVGVLKGALLFLADLARAIRNVDVWIDFLAISRFAPDSGRVRIVHDVDLDLTGRDVVVVEDLVDTGLTLGYLLGHLGARAARRVDVCTLLDRPTRRILPLTVRYVGLEIPDVFVLGYGLHVEDRFRNLDGVLSADRRAVRVDPDAFVRTLYRGVGPRVAPEEAGGRVSDVVWEAP